MRLTGGETGLGLNGIGVDNSLVWVNRGIGGSIYGDDVDKLCSRMGWPARYGRRICKHYFSGGIAEFIAVNSLESIGRRIYFYPGIYYEIRFPIKMRWV